jgi:hypothetical protein
MRSADVLDGLDFRRRKGQILKVSPAALEQDRHDLVRSLKQGERGLIALS